MSAPQYAATRTDDRTHIGKAIKQIIALMVEQGMSWAKATDAVGIKRAVSARAFAKPHVREYLRQQGRQSLEVLSARVPHKLNELMDSENHAAAVRACLAMQELSSEARAEPNTRRIQTGGIVIVIGQDAQRSLSHAAPALELQRSEVGDG